MSFASTTRLTWHTVRYLHPKQIGSRVRLKAAAKWRQLRPVQAHRRYTARAAGLDLRPSSQRWTDGAEVVATLASPSEIEASRARAEACRAGHFRFLSVSARLGRPVDWSAPGQSQLWRYKLQYCGVLVDTAVASPSSWDAIAALMHEWIEANTFDRVPDAWHPFVVSERVVNWLYAIFAAAPSPLEPRILSSLAEQCSFIDANLETDVRGNHLLKNLKAMAIAGTFWQGPAGERWLRRYVESFTRELDAQLLADGAHYERSPMYHLLVLQDALELIACIRAAGREVPDRLLAAAGAMVDYIPVITHPDGGVALFNDSVLDDAPRPAMIRAFASRIVDGESSLRSMTGRQALLCSRLPTVPPRTAVRMPSERPTLDLTDSGLVRLPIEDGVAIIDVGRACPDDLPAHAHADFFSFELSLGGERWIVDSGVGEYAAGSWREYYRSTRAHNTVEVDGEDQIECWGSFRVARRANVLGRSDIRQELVTGVQASHDGYRRLRSPLTVTRAMLALDARAWLVIDGLDGEAAHRWRSFIHAEPSIDVDLRSDTATPSGKAVLTRGDRLLTIAWFGTNDARVIRGVDSPRQGWYAPEFGQHLPAPVIVFSGAGQLPVTFGYLLAPHVMPEKVDVRLDGPAGLLVAIGSARYRITLDEPAIRVRRADP